MTTLWERVEKIRSINNDISLTYNQATEMMEKELREYAEEAVMREMDGARASMASEASDSGGMVSHPVADPKDCPPSVTTISHPTGKVEYVEHTSPRPTPEDALRAINAMTYVNMLDIPVFRQGLADLLAGRRDTPAARAITGESAINSSKTTEGK